MRPIEVLPRGTSRREGNSVQRMIEAVITKGANAGKVMTVSAATYDPMQFARHTSHCFVCRDLLHDGTKCRHFIIFDASGYVHDRCVRPKKKANRRKGGKKR